MRRQLGNQPCSRPDEAPSPVLVDSRREERCADRHEMGSQLHLRIRPMSNRSIRRAPAGLFAFLSAIVLAAACGGDPGHPPFDDADGSPGGNGPGSGGAAGEGGTGDLGGGPSGGVGASDTGGGGSGATAGGGTGGGSGGTPPGLPCGDSVCPFNSTCEQAGDEPMCECAPGLGTIHCTDIDECAEEPDRCGSNAACVNTFGGYSCQCQPAYAGDACDDDNECALSPCDPGATCAEVEGSYACSCTGTYGTGHACQGTDTCAADPCAGNGTCVVAPASARCQCDDGFEGVSDCTACGNALAVADAGLRAAVNVALGRTADDASDIPLADVAALTSLDASAYEVESLTGLECWPGLEELDLSYNTELSSLTTLTSLNRLKRLDVSCTAVTTLDGLAS